MTKRLAIFLLLCGLLVMAMGLKRFKSFKVQNASFDFKKEEKIFKDEQALLAASSGHHGDEEEAGEGEKGAKKEEVAASADATLIPLDTPELKNGMFVFTKKGQCLTCHGRSGEGKESQEAPKLAGQHNWYLEKQLHDMKNKVRNNPKMTVYLNKLEEQDIKDVALYLSKLPTK